MLSKCFWNLIYYLKNSKNKKENILYARQHTSSIGKILSLWLVDGWICVCVCICESPARATHVKNFPHKSSLNHTTETHKFLELHYRVKNHVQNNIHTHTHTYIYTPHTTPLVWLPLTRFRSFVRVVDSPIAHVTHIRNILCVFFISFFMPARDAGAKDESTNIFRYISRAHKTYLWILSTICVYVYMCCCYYFCCCSPLFAGGLRNQLVGGPKKIEKEFS